MKEFMCPDGTMSVNQICRMFMSKADRNKLAGIVPKPDASLITGTKNIVNTIEREAGTDIKNIPTPKKSFDEKYESIEDIPVKKPAQGFNFDFDQVTDFKESADSMITSNIDYYNNFVQDKFGISPTAQNIFRVGAALTASSAIGAIAPFAIPFIAGGALKAADNRRIQNITMNDPQGDITTIDPATVQRRMQIMSIQPTQQDIYRGGGPGRDTSPSGPTSQAGGFASDGGPVSNQTGRGRVGF